MKLLRYGERGAEKPGILDSQGRIRDLSQVVKDIAGDVLGPERLENLKGLDPGSLPAVESTPRLGAPVAVVPLCGSVVTKAEDTVRTALLLWRAPKGLETRTE